MRWLAYMISRLLAWLLLLPFVRLRVSGNAATALRGPAILASNHISHFDPPILAVAARRKIDWMAMVELFGHPIVGGWLRGIDSFPVDRARPDKAAIRTALARLKCGRLVGMFPEGGIRDGEASLLNGAPLRPGLAALAQMAQAPVIPCVILGTDRLYARSAWRPLRSIPVWIRFGPALPPPASGHEGREQFARELGEHLRRLYEELRKEYALSEEDLPQRSTRRKGQC